MFLLLLIHSAPSQVTDNVCTEESVRTAIAGGGLVTLECGTNLISLTRPIVISRDTTITSGSPTNEIVLSGGNITRLFIVQPGVAFRLENVAAFSGRQTETNAHHGGIPDTAGAAIYNNGGTVEIFRSRFDSHSVIGITGAPGDSGGDGERGEDGGDAAGAAIFNLGGTVIVSNSVFRANAATGGPGGNGGEGRNDTGDGGNGGSAGGAAIYSQGGTVRIFNSVFTNNTATAAVAGAAGAATGMLSFPGTPGEAGDAVGAAVAGANAVISIYGSTFVNNKATAADGADGSDGVRNLEGQDGRTGGAAAGGAVYNTGLLYITNSTFFANSATSGDGGDGGAGGTASFGFDAGDGGNGGLASGGAVEASGGGSIIHSTFSDNAVTAGEAGAGGEGGGSLGDDGESGSTGVQLGAAIRAETIPLILANSILANSSVLTLGGTIDDEGGNISTDLAPLLNSGNSYPNRNPMLRALANNGGPTPTMGIPTNSPAATNAAIGRFCVPFDQRGVPRLDGCDIGAYQSGNGTAPVVVPTNLVLSASLNSNRFLVQFPGKLTNIFIESSSSIPSSNWTTVATAFKFATNGSSVTTVLDVPLATTDNARFFRLNSTNSIPPFPQLPGANIVPDVPADEEDEDERDQEDGGFPPFPG